MRRPEHFEVLPFTDNIAKFDAFVGGVTADNRQQPGNCAADFPEDVIGGLARARGHSSTRVLFHIGDAPPHGKQYYTGRDVFPDGHPTDMPLRTLFAAMRGQRLQYYFGRITNKMDMMLEVFAEHHGEPIKPFDVSDPESIASSVTSSVLSSVSTASASVGSLRLPVALPALSPAMPDWQTIDEHPAVVTKLELPAHVSEISSMAALKKTTV